MLDQAVWEKFVRTAGVIPGLTRRRAGSHRANCSKDDWREFTINNYDNPTGLWTTRLRVLAERG